MVHAKAAKRHYVGFIRLELYMKAHPASARRHPHKIIAPPNTETRKMIALYLYRVDHKKAHNANAFDVRPPRMIIAQWRQTHNGAGNRVAPRYAAVAVNR